MTTLAIYNDTIKGLVAVGLTEIGGGTGGTDGSPLCLPTPSAWNLELGKEERVLTSTNANGSEVTVGSVVTAEKPKLMLTYGYRNPQVDQFIFGNKFVLSNEEGTIVRTVTIPANGEINPIEIGKLGYGILADSTDTTASALDEFGMSVALDRVSYSAGSAPAAGTFMQGANMALKFSPTQAGNIATIQSRIPSRQVVKLSEESIGYWKIRGLFVTNTGRAAIMDVLSATPEVGGKSFDPKAESVEIGFFLHNSPGKCQTIDFQYTNDKIGC